MALLMAGVATAGQSGGAKPANPVAQAVIDLENQWGIASKAANGDAIGALLADDFVALDSDGTWHGKA